MAAEQTNGALAGSSLVTKELPAATNALKELAGAATQMTAALRGGTRIQLAAKTARFVAEGAVDGMREDATYSRARTSSGNYASVTNDDLRRMEIEIAGPTGSRAKAAEALSGMVASGQVQLQVLQQAAKAAFELNRLGTPINDTVGEFQKLASDPLGRSKELNEKSNFLTPQNAKQIADFVIRGDNQAAAVVAQRAFATASIQKTGQEIKDMFFPDRVLMLARELRDLPNDLVRNVGRGTTTRQDYERAATARDNRMRRDGGAGSPMAETGGGAVVGFPRRPASQYWVDEPERQRELGLLKGRQAMAQGARASEAKSAVDAAVEAKETSDVERVADVFVAKLAAHQSKRAPAPSVSGSAERSRSSSAARGLDAGIQHAERDGLRSRVQVVCCDCKAGAGDSSKQAADKGRAEGGEARTEQSPLESAKTRQGELLESMRKSTSSVLEQTTALEAQNVAHGKTKSTLKELTIAQLERQYQDLDNTEQVIPGYLDALEARIDAEKKLLTVTRNAEGIEAADKEKKKNEDKAKKMSDDIGGAFREGFVNLLEGKDNALDKLGESLKKKITASVADALYDATLKPAVEAFSSWLPGAFKGIFSGGSGGGSTGSSSGSGGSWFGSLVSGVMSIFGIASAKGNVFASPGLHAYANSVVSQPTFFPFASGIGLMGEAGPEAIMPLRRGADGRLGVSAPGGGGNAVPTIQFAPSNVFHIDARSDRGAVMADMQRLLAENNRGQMEQLKRVKVLPQ